LTEVDLSYLLLSALLDKYERSRSYRERTTSNRRIMLKLYDGGQTDFPQYDIEQPELRVQINNAVRSLAGRKLIFYRWMKGEENHIIAQIWLDIENITDAYSFIRREPKNETIDAILRELQDAQNNNKCEWAVKFINDTCHEISQKRSIGHRSIGNRLPADPREREDLLRALCFIGQMEEMEETEILERVFSIRCFGDSKRFEKTVRSRLLGILSKYLDDDGEEINGENLLARIGIAKYPEQFEFCGNVAICIDTKIIDFSPLTHGAALNSTDLKRAKIRIAPEVTRILTIENRANYVDYLSKEKQDNQLAVYHGGQFSPAKGIFFKALTNSDASVSAGRSWYHWGDIDYGGFSMLARLRREIKPDIIPYRMNEAELRNHTALTNPFSKTYLKKLYALKQHPELADCFSCIDYMIEHKIRLEQEALLHT
jgi:hypothetical protein